MDVKVIVDILDSLPEIAGITRDRTYWEQVVPGLVEPVLADIVSRHDFDFTMAEYNDVTTIADQSEYTIDGGSNKYDCRDIVNVRYGDDGLLLNQYRTIDMDEIVSADQAPSSVFGWYNFKRSIDGFPIIVLVATPTTSGDVLTIRYRRKLISITEYPVEYGYVLALRG